MSTEITFTEEEAAFLKECLLTAVEYWGGELADDEELFESTYTKLSILIDKNKSE